EHAGKGTYKIICQNRHSNVTIVAPHGGTIEPGTSALVRAIAGRRYNIFDFQGLQQDHPWLLHVTSTHFRDPQLTMLLEASSTAVSVHSMGNSRKSTVWLGGLNRELKDAVLVELRKRLFDVNPDSPMYRGE